MPNTENTNTEVKKTLTADEKRAKRNAYAKVYYAMHKDQIKANCKRCRDKKRASKTAMHAICPDTPAVQPVLDAVQNAPDVV